MAKQVINVDIKDYSREVLEALDSQVKIALISIGQEAEGYAKEDCPVDTGRLRNSIANEVVENAVYVGTNVEYGVYVEYGDQKHKVGKKHFLRDSLANHAEHFKEILKAALGV